MKFTVSSLIAGLVLVSSLAFAQDKPVEKPAAVAAEAKPDGVPQVPDDSKKLLADLQAADAGYARAIAVLQKERDALSAEFTRTVSRLQVPGYDLTPALTYVKKAADPKK